MGKVAATRTPVSENDLFDALQRAWVAELGETPGRNSVALLVSQIMLETGGKSCVQWNLANAKGSPSWGGDWTYFTTFERVPRSTADAMLKANPALVHEVSSEDGLVKVVLTPDHPGCCFRAYKSLDEGALDYFKILRKHFSQAWPFIEKADPFGFCQSLHDHGYYTASPKAYTAAVCRIFDGLAEPQCNTNADYEDALTQWLKSTGVCLAGPSLDATKSFQAASGLTPDGIVGPLTRCKLRPFLAAARGLE